MDYISKHSIPGYIHPFNFIFTTEYFVSEETIVQLSGSNLPASALAEGCGKLQTSEYTACIVMIASTILKIARV